jgi:hypothetical protein
MKTYKVQCNVDQSEISRFLYDNVFRSRHTCKRENVIFCTVLYSHVCSWWTLSFAPPFRLWKLSVQPLHFGTISFCLSLEVRGQLSCSED